MRRISCTETKRIQDSKIKVKFYLCRPRRRMGESSTYSLLRHQKELCGQLHAPSIDTRFPLNRMPSGSKTKTGRFEEWKRVTCPGRTSAHSSTADQSTPQSLHCTHYSGSQDGRRSRWRRGKKLLEPPEQTKALSNNLPIDIPQDFKVQQLGCQNL